MGSMALTLAQNQGGGAGAGIIGIIFVLFYLAVIVLVIAGAWKTFVKAGQPGWGILIPFFNLYLMLKIAGRPGWWIILFFIPIVSLIVAIVMSYDIAKSFGMGIGMTLLLIFLPFIAWPVLGFGSAQYQGPAAGG